MQNTKTLWSPAEKAAWRLPEGLSVTQWADRHRILPAESAFPGRYRSDMTAYMAGPMDAFCDGEVEEIDIMSGSQVGKTTSVENIIGYIIDQDPGPTMYVVPRDADVEYVSLKRFRPMVLDCSALYAHTSGSPRDLQTNFFTFDRMTLYFGSAGSPAEMAQKAIKYLLFDEPDKYPPFSGKEANPIDLATKRTRTFWDRKIIKVCTPTTKDGYISVSYSQSNQQQYYIPCPHCGEYRVWKFAQLKLPKSLRDPDEIREKRDVWYECEVCGHRIEETEKGDLVAAGIWVPEGRSIDADGNITGEPLRSKRHSGFHISALVSPFPGVGWPEIMADWFAANTEQGIALGKLLDFQNATLGEPFEETGKQIKASEVRKLTGGFSRGTVPSDCLVLVASADYHKSKARGIVRIDYEVRGFGYGMKNRVVNTGSVSSFEMLDEQVLTSPFPWADGTASEDKPWLAVMVLFVDSGYEPDDVYEYCRKRPRLTIPTKGEVGPRLKPLQPSDLESATERRLARRNYRVRYRGMQLLIVDTYYFKNQVTGWVEARYDEEGKLIAEPLTNFYDEIPSYYFTEFTNEQLVKVRDNKGNVKWLWRPVTTGAPTHSLDTAVLCAAAAYYKGVHYLKRPDERPAGKRATGHGSRVTGHRRRTKGGGFLDNLPKL